MANERIIFLGTPEISSYLLEYMINNGFNIVGVVSQEDKLQGRKMILTPSPVSKVAMKYNIPLHRPHKLNQDYTFIEELKPDLLLTFAYGQIISTKVLGLSKYKPLNIHASILPKYRGASPIQACLYNGDLVTGISLMEMVKALDAGDVYALEKLDIDKNDNYSTLQDKLKELACNMVSKYLPLYFENKLIPTSQDESKVVFTHLISKEDEHLDLNKNPNDFVNQIRSLADIPGGYLIYNDMKLKIYKASVYDNSTNGELGQIVIANKKEIVLQVNNGTVKLEILQKPGKNKMSNVDFYNGNNKIQGEILK